MDYFRNPEVRINVVAQGLLILITSVIAFQLNRETGWLLLATFSFLLIINLNFTRTRYRHIANLTEEMEGMLHKQEFSPISAYEEGELSILRTQIHKMTQKMKEQQNALLHDKVYLSQSLQDISHQVKTPLTSLNLISDLLLEETLDKKRRRELVKEQIKLLKQIEWLISALLKMAKLDAETAKMTKEKVSVKQLIQRATEPLAIAMDIKGQELIVEQNGEESYIGDLYWSSEALLNILKNAIEHLPYGGQLSILVNETILFTEIEIKDNGPGIDKEDLPHLFERFYKGKNSSQNSVGIGLALSRMIIVQQGGTLKVENDAKGGAKFTIRFYKNTDAN